MACCGPSKSNIDPKELLKQLRNNDELIKLNLNQLKLSFEPDKADWKSKFLF